MQYRRLAASLLSLLCLLAPAGCQRAPQEGGPDIQRPYIGPEVTPPAPPTPEESERRGCEMRLRAVLAEPALPGAPAIEANRAMFLARTKAEPVLFTERPEYGPEPPTLAVQGYRQMLAQGGNAFGTVARILEESALFPKQARDALLRNGYLYAESSDLAYAMVSLVQPHQLFGHDRIWVQRGEEVLHAERRRGRYYYLDGLLVGERVRLLLFDRAGAGDAPPPIHRDLRTLRYQLHFDRMQVRHVTESAIVANLHYGRWWVPTVLRTEGAHVALECEVVAPELRAEVNAWRVQGERRQRVVQMLRSTMLAELDEALPFDEPLHEYGLQLDGLLRSKWQNAYLRHRDRYAFNGDAYQVFDPKGRPLTPQVCVDFLTDTLERTSGTFFRPRGEKPERVVGKLDFDALVSNRLEMRGVPGLVVFARAHPDWFDVEDVEEPIELGDRTRFFGYLADHVEDFAPGDAVLIKGKTPWDPGHVHYHSFFVYETDPITGMPLVVLGNAGRPGLRSWETEVRRTPKRVIVHRLRFSTEWLEQITGVPPLTSVPPLAAGPE
jgi:hypothetical protein